MSNFLAEPRRRRLLGNEKENEIRAIFYRHWESMKKQMKLTIDTIEDWRSQSIQEINTYAEEQMRILKADYDDQRLVFDQMRDTNLDTATAYHTSKQSDLFHELREICETLEFQVAQLEYMKNEIERPKVIIVEEQRRRKKQEYTNTYIPKYEEQEERWKVKDTTEDTRSASKSSPSRSSSSKRINDNLKNDVLTEECPTCCMAFSANMATRDRTLHISGHFAND